MKKIYSFLLLSVLMLISGNAWAQNVAKVGENEFTTLEAAVTFAEGQNGGVITLMEGYNRYPQAWVTPCVVADPTNFEDNILSTYTFHCFNPNNGDDAMMKKVVDGSELTNVELERLLEILAEMNPNRTWTLDDLNDLNPSQIHGYADWRADYEIYFDEAVVDADYHIVGQYSTYDWIPLSYNLTAGEKVNLLSQLDPNLHYYELVMGINQFHCGTVDVNFQAMAGKTISVELYIYDPANEDVKILISKQNYTFPSPVINFDVEVAETPENKEYRDELVAENTGVAEFTHDDSNIYEATSEYESDMEKFVVVLLTNIEVTTEEPVPGADYQGSLQTITYSVTPKYKDEQGELQVIPNSEITQPIKFRLPVISDYAGMMVNVYHKANDASEEDYVGMFPVQEMNGTYFVELAASEFSKYMIKDPARKYERETYAGMIGTICLPYNIAEGNATGATFYELDWKDALDNASVTEVEGTEVTELEGGKAYLFVAEGDKLTCVWDAAEEYTDVIEGTMIGNLASAPIYPAALASATVDPYVVTNDNIIRPCGPGATVRTNRAFINMTAVSTVKSAPVGKRVLRIGNGKANVATALESIATGADATKLLENGMIVILKDGVKYDLLGNVID